MNAWKKLIDWSNGEFNSLPWRMKRSLYHTLVSEIMLQQTTVSTVLNHFDKFIAIFPTLESLGNSSEEKVTLHWSGLGYYRRARNLLNGAKFIVDHHKGTIPLNFETLISIPGIGPYTASAIIAIGSNQKSLALDANLERVLSRVFNLKLPWGQKLKEELHKRFDQKKFPPIFYNRPREIHESLMDLGRNFCLAKKVYCEKCPLSTICLAHKKNDFQINKGGKKESVVGLQLVRFLITNKKNNEVLAYVKKKGQWLEGQIEVPTFILKSDNKNLTQYPYLKSDEKLKKLLKDAGLFTSHITKYKIKNFVVSCDFEDFNQLAEIQKKDFHFYALKYSANHFSTATLKSFKFLV